MILNNKVKEIDNDSLFYLKKLELKKEFRFETHCVNVNRIKYNFLLVDLFDIYF